MANRSPQDVAARRVAIINLIAGERLSVDEVHEQLHPRAGLRTVHGDISWMAETSSARRPGWRRLTFTTTGLAECQHSGLRHGRQVGVDFVCGWRLV